MKVKGEKFMKEELVFISLPLMFVLFLNENNFKKARSWHTRKQKIRGKETGQEGIMRQLDSSLDISDEGIGKKQAEKQKARSMRGILHIPKERDRNVEGLQKEVGRKYRLIMATNFMEKSISQILFET